MVEAELAIIGLLGTSLILLIWHIINKNDSGEGIELRKEIREMGSEQMKTLAALGESQQEHLATVSKNIEKLREGNEKKLDQMREIVDEKLQETLEKRITASFEIE